MAKFEITTEKCLELVGKYYETVKANGLLPKIQVYVDNIENCHLVVDGTSFVSAVNHTVTPISEDSDLIEGYLIVPYQIFCGTHKDKNIFDFKIKTED